VRPWPRRPRGSDAIRAGVEEITKKLEEALSALKVTLATANLLA